MPNAVDTDVGLDAGRGPEMIRFSEALDAPSMLCAVNTNLALDELSLLGDI